MTWLKRLRRLFWKTKYEKIEGSLRATVTLIYQGGICDSVDRVDSFYVNVN